MMINFRNKKANHVDPFLSSDTTGFITSLYTLLQTFSIGFTNLLLYTIP